jgi:hypothetical protein
MVINELMSSRKWKVPRCVMELPPPAKFHHKKNSSTSKIWQLVEQRQNQKNLSTNAKIGVDERKRKGGHQGEARICRQQQNYKSVKMIINYGG